MHALRVNNPNQCKEKDVELAVKTIVHQLHDCNAKVSITKLESKDPCMYQITLDEPRISTIRPSSASAHLIGLNYLPKERFLSHRVRLMLSGGNLMVNSGGGAKLLVEFLEHKGYL